MSAPKRTPRRSTFVVHQGDYGHRLEELTEKALRAKKKEDREAKRVSPKSSEAFKLAKEHDALVEEARASDIVLELQKPPRSVIRKLQDKHPPRDDHQADKMFQVDVDAFAEDAVPLCIPVFAEDQPAAVWDEENELVVRMPQWVEFAETFSEREWDALVSDVLVLLYGVADLPKESLVSTLQEMSKQESKSQSGSPRGPRQRLTDGPKTTSSTPGPTSSESGDSAPTAETPTP